MTQIDTPRKQTERPQFDIDLGRFDGNPAGIGFWALVREDLATHDGDWLAQGFWTIFSHRFGNWRMGVRQPILRWPLSLLYRMMVKLIEWMCGISLLYTVRLGRRVRIWHYGGMQLNALSIGNDVQIRQNVTIGLKRGSDARWLKPVIEDGCDVGAGAVIVGGIVIGRESVIGANVVIAQDVPAGSIVTVQPPVIRARGARG